MFILSTEKKIELIRVYMEEGKTLSQISSLLNLSPNSLGFLIHDYLPDEGKAHRERQRLLRNNIQ